MNLSWSDFSLFLYFIISVSWEFREKTMKVDSEKFEKKSDKLHSEDQNKKAFVLNGKTFPKSQYHFSVPLHKLWAQLEIFVFYINILCVPVDTHINNWIFWADGLDKCVNNNIFNSLRTHIALIQTFCGFLISVTTARGRRRHI